MARHLRLQAALACAVIVAAIGAGCGDDSPVQPSSTPAVLKVNSVSPSTGSTTAATPIRISGTGFQAGAKLLLDNVERPAQVLSPVLMSADAPAHAAGAVDIVVTNPDGQSSRLERAFTYVLPVTGLSISGNTSLSAVGETSQLTVTATYGDGTTADVTRETRWSMSMSSVATVGPDGVLTALGLGGTYVTAQYSSVNSSRSAQVFVTVTPPGTFTVSGRVREPGAGDLTGARVLHVLTGESVLTLSGNYSMGGLRDGRLSVTRDGFEPVELDATPNGFDDVPLQRVIRVVSGSPPMSYTLAPNDVEYLVGPDTVCQPCRMIRIAAGTSSTVRVRVVWNDGPTLNLWVDGQAFAPGNSREITADLPVSSGADRIVHVGKIKSPASGYMTFTISVSPGS